MLNHLNWILYEHPCLFCAMIVIDKLRENWKNKTKFIVVLFK